MLASKRIPFFVVATSIVIFLAGCGGSSNHPTPPPNGFTDASLSGTYAFSFVGSDAGGFYAVAGSLQADAAGHITSGVEDINRTTGVFTSVPITGTYNIRSDGRGVATLTSLQGNFSLSFVLISSSHAMISRFESIANGSGSLDLQSASAFSTAALAGTFAINLTGADAAGNAETVVGSVTTDATGAVTSGVEDSSDNGAILTNQAITTAGSSIAVGPSNGRGTATIVTTLGTLHFAFYVVDANRLKLVQTDVVPVLAGEAFRQTGPFTNASLTGPFAFVVSGADATVLGPFAAGGVLTSNGAGVITSGTEDINDAGVLNTNLAITGTYSISGNRGTMSLTSTAGTFNFVIYPSSSGVQVMETDAGVVVSGNGLQQTGSFSNSSIQGTYAMQFAGVTNAGELDSTAEFTANGAGSLTGITDINNVGSITSGTSLQGTYNVAANGRGPLTLNTGLGSQNMAVYVVDATRALFVEFDNNVVLVGEIRHQ
ncbi:MAG: hypothetical protein LAO20_00190 [Acidobacteriia bacterium]|nr:hypothetical protein [Terriglobia bacterium]